MSATRTYIITVSYQVSKKIHVQARDRIAAIQKAQKRCVKQELEVINLSVPYLEGDVP